MPKTGVRVKVTGLIAGGITEPDPMSRGATRDAATVRVQSVEAPGHEEVTGDFPLLVTITFPIPVQDRHVGAGVAFTANYHAGRDRLSNPRGIVLAGNRIGG